MAVVVILLNLFWVRCSSTQSHTRQVPRLRGWDNHRGYHFGSRHPPWPFSVTHFTCTCLLFQQNHKRPQGRHRFLYLPQCLATVPTHSMFSIIARFNWSQMTPGRTESELLPLSVSGPSCGKWGIAGGSMAHKDIKS